LTTPIIEEEEEEEEKDASPPMVRAPSMKPSVCVGVASIVTNAADKAPVLATLPPPITPKARSRPSSLLASIETVIAQHHLLQTVIGDTTLDEEPRISTEFTFSTSDADILKPFLDGQPREEGFQAENDVGDSETQDSMPEPPMDELAPSHGTDGVSFVSSGIVHAAPAAEKEESGSGKPDHFFKRLLKRASSKRLGKKKKEKDEEQTIQSASSDTRSSRSDSYSSYVAKSSLDTATVSSLGRSSASKVSIVESEQQNHDAPAALSLILPAGDSNPNHDDDDEDMDPPSPVESLHNYPTTFRNMPAAEDYPSLSRSLSQGSRNEGGLSTQERLEAMIIQSQLAEQMSTLKRGGLKNRSRSSSPGKGTLPKRGGMVFADSSLDRDGTTTETESSGSDDDNKQSRIAEEGRSTGDNSALKTEKVISKLDDLMGTLMQEVDQKRKTVALHDLQMMDMDSVLSMSRGASRSSIQTQGTYEEEKPLSPLKPEAPKKASIKMESARELLKIKAPAAAPAAPLSPLDKKKKRYVELRASIPPGSLDPILLDRFADLKDRELVEYGAEGFEILLMRLEASFASAVRAGAFGPVTKSVA
jgi:hypothetical protein